jgi:hypothetical protein
MINFLKKIGKKKGIAAFYKGLIPSLLKSSISTCASFWLLTLTKKILQSTEATSNPNASPIRELEEDAQDVH